MTNGENIIEMMDLPEEEQANLRRRLMGMCICRDCPSYKGTGETQVLFCGLGKSSAITEERGCTCGGCPITPQMGLTKLYYCTKGSEAQQRSV